MKEQDTTFIKKPWWKRTEVIASFIVVVGPIVLSGLAYLGNHTLAMWNNPAQTQVLITRETRLEYRVMRIEQALNIKDNVPYSSDATNKVTLASVGITNQTIILDP